MSDSRSLDDNLRKTIEHFYNSAPAFRRRLDSAGLHPHDIRSIDDLAKLPILRKDDLIELQRSDPPFGGMLTIPTSELRRVFQSPGPINEPGPRLADSGRWAVALEAAGFRSGEIVMNCFGYHMTPAGTSLENSLETIGCVVIPGGTGNQEQQVQMMVTFAVSGYVGLPSYLKALMDKAAALGTDLHLRHAFVLAEPLPPSLRQELKERGVEVFQGYGTAECGNLGYECERLDGWHVPDDVIVQICDMSDGSPLPPGETGEVVATSLGRHYAIVRFGVGDLSSLNIEPCACGRSGVRLNGWQGRVGEAAKVRGMFLHPRQLAAVMDRFPEVVRYQVVISRRAHRDELALQIVARSDADAPGHLVDKIQDVARQALKFRLDVQMVDALQLAPGSPPIKDNRSWE